TDAANSAPPTATVMEDAMGAAVTISAGASQYKLSFSKSGDMAGHLTATLMDGTSCDQDLGSMGGPPTRSGGSRGGGGGGGNGGAGAYGGRDGVGASGGGGKSACGCRTVGEGELSAAWAAIALAAAALGRRKRSWMTT